MKTEYDANTERLMREIKTLDPSLMGLLHRMVEMKRYQKAKGAAYHPFTFHPWNDAEMRAGSEMGWLHALMGAKKVRLSSLGLEVVAVVEKYPEVTR